MLQDAMVYHVNLSSPNWYNCIINKADVQPTKANVFDEFHLVRDLEVLMKLTDNHNYYGYAAEDVIPF